MNLFELFVKIGVDDQASNKLFNLSSKLGNGLKTAAKIGTAAVGAAAAGITALTTAAVNNYAEYEQLVGGVETLFKGSADKVQEYAANAYKTAGMSANEYMSTVTSFSAALLRSVGGDTEKAAKLADTAITDMSDNANKMGVSLESLQNAYTGFSRGNFTMLDNLALGFSGTKEGMQELLDTAEELSGVKYDIGSYADIVEAIHIVQTEMGITGTTAKEAASTIQGSVGMMKSAWANLVTGIADENADLDKLITDFVDSVGVTVENVLPKIHTVLVGSAKLIENLIPAIMEEIPVLINDTLPQILTAGINVIKTILNGIKSNPDEIVNTIINIVTILVDAFIDLAPDLLVVGAILIAKLAVGLIRAIPDLVKKVPVLIKEIVSAFSKESGTFSNIGKNIVDGILSGLKKSWDGLKKWFKNAWDGLVGGVKDLLGIHSPSRVFASIGENMALGVGEGWDDIFGEIQRDIDKSLDFSDPQISIGRSNGMFDTISGIGGTSIGNITINIDGARYEDEQSLAEAIAEELQALTERKAAVYA